MQTVHIVTEWLCDEDGDVFDSSVVGVYDTAESARICLEAGKDFDGVNRSITEHSIQTKYHAEHEFDVPYNRMERPGETAIQWRQRVDQQQPEVIDE